VTHISDPYVERMVFLQPSDIARPSRRRPRGLADRELGDVGAAAGARRALGLVLGEARASELQVPEFLEWPQHRPAAAAFVLVALNVAAALNR
jgi:hypothetical protein